MSEKEIKVKHGIIEFEPDTFSCFHRRGQHAELEIPLKFYLLLRRFSKSTKRNRLEFSVAYDEEEDYWAITIVHPRDYFNRRIGRKIVEGRVLRMKGLIPNRKPYYPIPEWMFVGVI